MPVIDVGTYPINQPNTFGGGSTVILKNNPANGSGNLTDFLVWANSNLSGTNKVGCFYFVSGTTYTCRSAVTIGSITAGSLQTFTGLSFAVVTGDLIGMYWSSGNMEGNLSVGAGYWAKVGDQVSVGNSQSYASVSNRDVSFYAEIPLAPPSVSSVRISSSFAGFRAVGNLTAKNGATVTKRGVAYNTTGGDPDPTVDSKIEETGDFETGEFIESLSGLALGATYYVRPYAYNSAGYGYGTTMTIVIGSTKGLVTASTYGRLFGYPADGTFAAMRAGGDVHVYQPPDTNPDNLGIAMATMTASPWLFRTFLDFDLTGLTTYFTAVKLHLWCYSASLIRMIVSEGVQDEAGPTLANWLSQNGITVELGRLNGVDAVPGGYVTITLDATGLAFVQSKLGGLLKICLWTEEDFTNNYILSAHNDEINFYLSQEAGKEPYLEFVDYGDEADRIYVWLGTKASPKQIELTDPDYPLIMGARTERGRDEELGHAAAGICELVCDNQFGDFSPDKATGALYGLLLLGAFITHYEVYGGIEYDHFAGKIDKIVPHGEPDNLTAYILAVDGMDDLAGSEIETPLRITTGAHALLDDIHDAVNWPAGDRTFDASIDVLQLGWYHETKALDEIQALEEMERGFYLIDVDGTALWQNRHYRVTGARLVSQFDFNENFIELAYQYSKRELRNWARVTGARYVQQALENFVWSTPTNYAGAPKIPANGSATIWAPLAGPLHSHDALVAGTHWNANTGYDKAGDDLTADVSIVATDYGQSIKFVVTNASDRDAYLVVPDSPPTGAPADATLIVSGYLYEEESLSVVKEDTTSRDAYGKRTISIDAKFKSNYNDLLSYAEWLIQRYKDPLPSPVMGKVSAWTNYPDDTIKIQCLTRKISDRITAASTKLGIDTDFFIDKIIQEYVALEGGWVHNTTYSLSRAEGQAEGQFWLLGEVGFSELGETTRLGF